MRFIWIVLCGFLYVNSVLYALPPQLQFEPGEVLVQVQTFEGEGLKGQRSLPEAIREVVGKEIGKPEK